MSYKDNDDKNASLNVLSFDTGHFFLSEPHTVYDPPPGFLLNETEEGLYFQSQSLSQFPPGKYRQQKNVKLQIHSKQPNI